MKREALKLPKTGTNLKRTRRRTQPSVEGLVAAIDFPHTRSQRGEWLATKSDPKRSFLRLTFYAAKLRELGMSDADIAGMFSDLYWDAFEEFGLNETYDHYPKPRL